MLDLSLQPSKKLEKNDVISQKTGDFSDTLKEENAGSDLIYIMEKMIIKFKILRPKTPFACFVTTSSKGIGLHIKCFFNAWSLLKCILRNIIWEIIKMMSYIIIN